MHPITNNLAKSFVRFQSMAINPPKKKVAKIGDYSYKYADLGDIMDCIRKPLAECGLGFYQDVVREDGKLGINTTILHESGEAITFAGVMMDTKDANTPQKLGSLITYARRYSLQIALGLITEEDTDTNDLSTPLAEEDNVKKARKLISEYCAENKISSDRLKELVKREFSRESVNFLGINELRKIYSILTRGA